MATYSKNMIVNRAISGATTVNSNCYATVDYKVSSVVNTVNANLDGYADSGKIITRYFGPSQSIPGSFTTIVPVSFPNAGQDYTQTTTWTLISGVEFTNQ